ncbi:MAG: hypothetical protein MI922_13335 [Bacteroidales bacterium]|nr:hypothetical protein [Bacteroidales bacterium]
MKKNLILLTVFLTGFIILSSCEKNTPFEQTLNNECQECDSDGELKATKTYTYYNISPEAAMKKHSSLRPKRNNSYHLRNAKFNPTHKGKVKRKFLKGEQKWSFNVGHCKGQHYVEVSKSKEHTTSWEWSVNAGGTIDIKQFSIGGGVTYTNGRATTKGKAIASGFYPNKNQVEANWYQNIQYQEGYFTGYVEFLMCKSPQLNNKICPLTTIKIKIKYDRNSYIKSKKTVPTSKPFISFVEKGSKFKCNGSGGSGGGNGGATIGNTRVSAGKGSIKFTYQKAATGNNWHRTHIKFYIKGPSGSKTVKKSAKSGGSHTFKNLKKGTYKCYVAWGDDSNKKSLGSYKVK